MTMKNENSQRPSRVVGLKYDPAQGLPQIVVKGSGYLADEILRRRDWLKQQPLVKHPELVDQLYRLPVDARISPAMFELVAALLLHVFSVEELLRRNEA